MLYLGPGLTKEEASVECSNNNEKLAEIVNLGQVNFQCL